MCAFGLPTFCEWSNDVDTQGKVYIPNLSSPKLPEPIFFPTLKLGPTIMVPVAPPATLEEAEDILNGADCIPSCHFFFGLLLLLLFGCIP